MATLNYQRVTFFLKPTTANEVETLTCFSAKDSGVTKHSASLGVMAANGSTTYTAEHMFAD